MRGKCLLRSCLNSFNNLNIRCRTNSIILNSFLCKISSKCMFHNSNTWCHRLRINWISTNILVSICNQCKFRLFLRRCHRYTTTISSLICKVMKIRLMVQEGLSKICRIFSRTWLRSFPRWTSVIRTRTQLMRYQIWALRRTILPNLFSNLTLLQIRSRMMLLTKKPGLITYTKCFSGTNKIWTWISCKGMSSSVARTKNVLGSFKNVWS